MAVKVAHTIGPIAARHRLLIAIRPGDAETPTEVFAIDRHTGVMRCWACGSELDDTVAGTTVIGAQHAARGKPILLVRSCSCTAELAPSARSASA